MTRTPSVDDPAGSSAHRAGLPKRLSPLLGLVGTAVLLPLIFPPFYCFFLAPIALVPFCESVLRRPMWPRYLWAYYGLGVAFFLMNLFWIGPVTILGLVALSLYIGIYFPLFAWGFRRLVVDFRLPATIALPVAWTAVEYVRATFVQGGFPWFVLGNSFATMPVLVQTADLFGVWGVTFFIAMLNGCVVDLLRLPWRGKTQNTKRKTQNDWRGVNPAILRLILGNLAMVLVVLGYGIFRMNQRTQTPGPRVAVIQENIPQSLKEDPSKQEENFQRYFRLAQSASIATPPPDLIVWPETMVPASINREILGLDERRLTDEGQALVQRAKRYDAALRELSTTSHASQLVGVPAFAPDNSEDGGKQRNITLLYEPVSGQSDALYAKIHLVPFGEYIPFRTWPLLGPLTNYLLPHGFDVTLTPGNEWTRFRLNTQQRSYTFATPICFEDTMPEPPRMMSFDGTKKTDFLANVSNDGWFYYVELDQHLQADQVRAVENRIPIARSVNTGDSGFVDSNGRVVMLVRDTAGGAGGGSIGAVGTVAMTMQVDSRITLFSRIGDLLPIVCGVAATLMIAWTYVRPRRGRLR